MVRVGTVVACAFAVLSHAGVTLVSSAELRGIEHLTQGKNEGGNQRAKPRLGVVGVVKGWQAKNPSAFDRSVGSNELKDSERQLGWNANEAETDGGIAGPALSSELRGMQRLQQEQRRRDGDGSHRPTAHNDSGSQGIDNIEAGWSRSVKETLIPNRAARSERMKIFQRDLTGGDEDNVVDGSVADVAAGFGGGHAVEHPKLRHHDVAFEQVNGINIFGMNYDTNKRKNANKDRAKSNKAKSNRAKSSKDRETEPSEGRRGSPTDSPSKSPSPSASDDFIKKSVLIDTPPAQGQEDHDEYEVIYDVQYNNAGVVALGNSFDNIEAVACLPGYAEIRFSSLIEPEKLPDMFPESATLVVNGDMFGTACSFNSTDESDEIDQRMQNLNVGFLLVESSSAEGLVVTVRGKAAVLDMIFETQTMQYARKVAPADPFAPPSNRTRRHLACAGNRNDEAPWVAKPPEWTYPEDAPVQVFAKVEFPVQSSLDWVDFESHLFPYPHLEIKGSLGAKIACKFEAGIKMFPTPSNGGFNRNFNKDIFPEIPLLGVGAKFDFPTGVKTTLEKMLGIGSLDARLGLYFAAPLFFDVSAKLDHLFELKYSTAFPVADIQVPFTIYAPTHVVWGEPEECNRPSEVDAPSLPPVDNPPLQLTSPTWSLDLSFGLKPQLQLAIIGVGYVGLATFTGFTLSSKTQLEAKSPVKDGSVPVPTLNCDICHFVESDLKFVLKNVYGLSQFWASKLEEVRLLDFGFEKDLFKFCLWEPDDYFECGNTCCDPDNFDTCADDRLVGPTCSIDEEEEDGKKSGVFGDPHISTFDRLRFDCQAAGEFVTVTSLEDPSLQIQERFTSVSSDVCSQASISTGVAIADKNTPTVQLSTPRNGTTSLNAIGGCPIDFFVDGVAKNFSAGAGAKVSIRFLTDSSVRIIHTETSLYVDITVRKSDSWGCHFMVQVFVANGYRPGETILGLLGTPNGNRNDDWRARDGAVLPPPSLEEESIFSPAYNYCVKNWCIDNEGDSVFTYRSGESFDSVGACNESYYAHDIEEKLNNAPQALSDLCQGNLACMVDGICGDMADALQALEDQATVREESSPPCFVDSDELRSAIHYYRLLDCSEDSTCLVGQVYGWPMNSWCVSRVTDMNRLFYNWQSFNESLDQWDTSSVLDMSEMFQGASIYNHDLPWNISSVVKMNAMFRGASSFNQDLCAWAEKFPYGQAYEIFVGTNCTFQYTPQLGPQAPFCASLCNDTITSDRCFGDRSELKTAVNNYLRFCSDSSCAVGQIYGWPMNSWCVSKVTDMNRLFYNWQSFDESLDQWDTSSVLDMSLMFWGASSFNRDLPWNTSRVVNMNSMFQYASSFDGNISSWDTSSVRYMDSMFSNADAFNRDLSLWDVSSVQYMGSMFYDAEAFNGDVSTWDVSSVQEMSWMFRAALAFNQDISSWDVSYVQEMQAMFALASAFNQDISSWNISAVEYEMRAVFYGASSFNQDLCAWADKFPYDWADDIFTDSNCTFRDTPQLGLQAPFCASLCKNFTADRCFGDRDELHTAVDNYVYFCSDSSCAVGQIYGWPINSWCVGNVTDMSSLFSYDKYDFNESLSNWDTSAVTDMNHMFYNARDFMGDISTWDTSRVMNMAGMFADAYDFAGNISSWNTSSVVDMTCMFCGTRHFNTDISLWETSSVKLMTRMFEDAEAFNRDLSLWDISSIEEMSSMFEGASSFNQSLCSWKDDFPYDNAFDIFEDSNCKFPFTPQSDRQGPFCSSDCNGL